MRRRPPPEVDPDRLRSLLASARPRPEPTGPTGWVPEGAPASVESADLAWLDERPLDLVGGDPVGDEVVGEGSVAGDPAAGGRHRPPPRVLTVPLALRGARVAVSVRAVVAFVVVLVVAVVFFAVRVARAQEAAVPQALPAGEGVVGRAVPSAFASGSAAGGTGSSSPRALTNDPAATSGATARGSPGRLVVIDV